MDRRIREVTVMVLEVVWDYAWAVGRTWWRGGGVNVKDGNE